MKSKLYLGVALACSAAAAILPVHALAADAEGAAAEQTKTAQEAAEATPVALNTFDVDGVVVTATRMPQAITDVPANVSVITAQEIEDNHYNNLKEALSNVNGVVATTGGAGSQDIVMLNGDDRVLVMVDGKRVNSDQGLGNNRATADLRMIPPMSMIERIEVVKGGASSIYGSDAVGGVINIITKKGTKDMKTTIDAAYGSWHQGDYQITNQGSVKDFSWMVSGSISRHNDMKVKDHTGDKFKAPNSDGENRNAAIRLDYQLNKRDSLTLNYAHNNAKDGANTNASHTSNGSYYKRIQNSVDLTFNFKEGTKAPGFLRLSHTNKKNMYMDKGIPQAQPFKYKTDFIEYQNGWELGKDHILIAGLDWRQTKATNELMGYNNKKLENTAVYIQDTWNISKKWSVVPGIRMDHHNKYGTKWSPKVAVNFTPDKKNQLYASWGRVFKAPQADDLWYDAYGHSTIGNPDLKPETGWTANIGWNHEFNKSSSLGINVFQSNLKNAIHWKEVAPWTYNALNINREKKRGLEITYKQKLNKHWSYDAGMSFTHIERNQEWSPDNRDYSYPSPNSYRLGINYKNRGWFVGLNTTIASGRHEATLGNKHYALIDLNASYTFNDTFKVYLKGLNLTNQFYTIGTSMYTPGRGRFIQMGVQVSF